MISAATLTPGYRREKGYFVAVVDRVIEPGVLHIDCTQCVRGQVCRSRGDLPALTNVCGLGRGNLDAIAAQLFTQAGEKFYLNAHVSSLTRQFTEYDILPELARYR